MDIAESVTVDTDEESEIDECTFIKLVECRPWLYDAEHPKYKNNTFKEETWRLIANTLGWEDDEEGMTGAMKCKSAWKRLRDNFMRAMRKLLSGAGAEDIVVMKKKPVYEALMFLHNIKVKNTRKSSGNFSRSALLPKKIKIASPLVPREQWSDEIIINENHSDEDTQGSKNKENTSTETGKSARQLDFEQAGPSGAAVKSNFSSSPLPFEAAIKRPPPKRRNPPIDTFAKKKGANFNKFEEMLSKGFENLNAMLKPPAAAPKPKSANATLCEYLLSELEEIPKEKQAAVRLQIIVHFNSIKDA